MEVITKGKTITVIFDNGTKMVLDKEKLDKFGQEPKKDRILNPDFATITIADLPKLSFRDRAKLAGMPNISDEMVHALLNDDSGFVRFYAAIRTDLASELINKLANDGDYHVRLAVATRIDLSPDLIAKLIVDKNPSVRYRAISRHREKLTEEQLRYLKENETAPEIQRLLKTFND